MNNLISAAPLHAAMCAPRVNRRPMVAMSDLLHKAAAPTFAAMAFLSSLSEHAMPTCAAIAHAGHLCSMTGMYLLMAVFHLSAWLPRGSAAALQSTSRSES